MSVNQKMTAIADEVRTLAGVADKLNLDDMAAHTHDANTEVGTQENLIEQIRTALQGKSAADDRYDEGYADGLAARTYEIWTITYVDGTIEEKEVALL